MLRPALTMALLLAGTGVRAGAAQEAPPISVDVQLVVLHATVTNGKGAPVSDLEKKDFRVYENGQPQTIGVFQHEDVPVAVGLAVDDSGSMRPKRAEVAVAAEAFARASNPEDRMFVINFNEYVTFGLPAGMMFSDKPSQLAAAITRAPAQGRTALYDAIEAGLARLRQSTIRTKVLIVISDGGDNASVHTLPQVIRDAEASDVTIYAIGIFDDDDSESKPGVLKKLARVTGGEAFFPDRLSSLLSICEGIARDIRTQYTIGYTPTDVSPGYRTVRVTATRGHEKLIVRTRSGYFAEEGVVK